MTSAQVSLALCNDIISARPAAEQEAVRELASHIRTQLRMAGSPVGELALCLVKAEWDVVLAEVMLCVAKKL